MKNNVKVIQILVIKLIFFLTIFCVPSVSIAGWTQLISPTSQNLNSVWFADASNGVCVGDNGTVALTSDGITFQNYSIAGGTNLNGVHYSPDVAGVPAYENFNAYSVTDPMGDPTTVTINGRYEAQVEGMSQEFMDTYVTMDYSAGHFDDTAGYTHYFEYTLSPTNQDENWVCPWVVADGLLAYNDLNSGYSFCTWENNNGTANVEIYNNNTDVAYSCMIVSGYAGPGTRVYGTATVNPGGNAEIRLYQDSARTTLIPFQGGGCAWPMNVAASAGSYRYIYAIDTDTRASWSNMNSLISRNIDINELNIFAAASADNVYRSTSAGAGWYPDTTGSGVQMNDVHFRDDQNGWAVGENGSIYMTSNAGEAWISQSTGSASLHSVFFINANNGWIAGSGGTILYTTSGGSLWQSPVSGVPAVDLYNIHFVSTTIGWAVGDNGTIIKTTDGGVNWSAQTSTTTNRLNSVYFANANTGYATGMADTILKTTDGGTTWLPQSSPSSGNNFNDIFFVDANTGYICGDNGVILNTTDGGGGSATNFIVMHPTASTVTDDFALVGCASSFDCVNDQPLNAGSGLPLAVDNDGAFYLEGTDGQQVLFDLDDSAALGIPAASTITGIEIFAQAYRENAGGGATYQLSYDIGGGQVTEPVGTTLVRGNYQLMSYAWTGLTWSTTDLDNLKIGVVQSGVSTSYLGQLYVYVTYIPAHTISGRVFEDVNYAGGSGTAFGGGDAGLDGVEVELYDVSGNWIRDADALTAVGGLYTITGIPNGVYIVRVRSATITARGAGTLPEQTYEHNGSTGNGGNGALGGNDSWARDPDTGNNNVGSAGDTNVTVVLSSDLSGVDFGFSYNLITNTRNSGQGSLRQFITNANTIAGGNSSQFFIPDTDPNVQTAGANSWWRIMPFSALPSISDNNTILDGSTQSLNYGSDSNSIGPEIEIVGTFAGGGANGITVSSDNNTVAGFIINRFSWNGIMINGTGNQIWGNWLGIDATGVIDQGNADNGIEVNGSSNVIGGDSDIERNVISGNTDEGIDINPGIPETIITGNYIGTDYTGTASIPNGQPFAGHWGGVLVEGDNTVIGGSLPGEGNVISGNYQWGLYISSNGNTVLGNYIGTDALGTSALGNMGQGIEIDGAFGGSNNTVGGVSTGEGNIISHNNANGIMVLAGSGAGNIILGNTISDNTANGVNSNADSVNIIKNLIVSNGAGATDGVRIDTGGTNNKIYHNTIHGNADDGIIVYANGTFIRNNVITGHSGNGLQILGGSMSESNNLITNAFTNPPNGAGASNTPLDATTITNQDPLYVNTPADDYRLTECTSPAIDAGLDLGGDQPDMNGATAGLWNGVAPDAGAFESSCGISLSIVKQIWEVGGTAPLASPITLPQNGRYVFLIYVKNTTAGSVSDIRISDVLDDAAFQYIAGTLHRDDGSLSDAATDLAIFNATKPPGRGGPGISMSDAVDGDIASAQDTGGPADVDSITIGTVPAQSNGTLNISGNTTFAIRFEVFIR
jgi:photosystem II stability/assembly factor-like uncharacterized protein